MSKQNSVGKKLIAIGTLLAAIALIVVIVIKVCMPMLQMADNPDAFRAYMEEKGLSGILLFIFVLAIQVVAAVIPAGPLEVVAGYSFGAIKGALIADIGMTIGSVIVFLLVRKFGMSFIEIFMPREKIESLKFLKKEGGATLIIFMLFLIPGAPKDVLGYGAGLTDISLLTWIFIVSVGRFPSILLTVMGGDAISGRNFGYLLVVLIVMCVVTVLGTLFYKRWQKKQ